MFGRREALLSLKERAEFFYHLARLAEVGGNVRLWVTTWTPRTKRGQACRRQLAFYIGQGLPLATALRETRMFDPLECALIRLGEETGNIARVAAMLAENRESQLELRRKIRNELFMPAVEMLAAFIAFLVIVYFVIPQFEGFLRQAGVYDRLPHFTRTVFEVAGFARHWGWLAAGLLIAAALGFWRALRTNYLIALRVPLVSRILRFRLYSIIFLYLHLLVEAGVSLPRTFELIEKSFAGDSFVSRTAERVRGILEKRSYDLARTFQAIQSRTPIFSKEVVALVDLGERFGQMPAIAERAFRMYSRELERSLQALARAALPVTLVLVAGLVGCLIVGIMVPIFQIAFTFMGGG